MPPNSEIEKLERRWRDNPKGTVFAPYAEVLRKNGDHELARDVLRQGLQLHPDHIPGNIVLGRCCLDLGEDGPAEAAFSHVLELDTENVIALKALADITERQGRLAEAHDWLSRLIMVDPSNDEARDQFARVAAARETASAAMAPDLAVPQEPAPIVVATEVAPLPIEVVPSPIDVAPALIDLEEAVEPNRSEIGGGVIRESESREALTLDQAFDSVVSPSPGAITRKIPAFKLQQEAMRDLEPVELDLSAVGDASAKPLEGIEPEQPFVPPTPETPIVPAASTPEIFAFASQEIAPIELSPSDQSEFQAPDVSDDLVGLSAGKSEFQVPDDSEALLELAAGNSEFQIPDASQELGLAGNAASEYQSASGAEELLQAVDPAKPVADPAPRASPSEWEGGEISGTLAAMAAMPTQELATPAPPESVSGADDATPAPPAWMFEDEEQTMAVPAMTPAADVAPAEPARDEPKAALEPVDLAEYREEDTGPVESVEPAISVSDADPPPDSSAGFVTTRSETMEPEFSDPRRREPEPEEEPAEPSSAELRLIFPEDSSEPPPQPVRRITAEVTLAAMELDPPEPAAGDPALVVTETMAELYARQGHMVEALKVYRALAQRQPDEARLQERIRELETRATAPPRRMTYVAMETGGESVESFFRALADARPGIGGSASGFGSVSGDDSSGAPTRPARDPLSLSAIFGEDPAAAASAAAEPAAPAKPIPGPDAFSFDQFFGASPGSASSTPSRPAGASEEDLDQFQHWLKSLKR